jgi:hypothetical protein
MSTRDHDDGKFGVLRSPGSGTGRPEEEREAVTTTQTSGGLAAGDPTGGPHRTPERQAIDEAREQEPAAKSGRDPDLNEPVRTPEDVDATPPHGDVPGKA